jgi:hypothetical protein
MSVIEKLSKHRFYKLLLFVFFVGLLATRRWAQIQAPQVWDEDGTQILYGYLTQGWHTFFEPVNGYLITVPRIISMVSLGISFLHYPIISTVMTWTFISCVGVAIAVAPIRLRGRFLCATAVFMVPTSPEVFGTPLYTFWWSSLLLFIIAIWDEKHLSMGWRLAFLFLGGLSSPVIVLILPILYFRVYLYRSLRFEYVMAIVATLIALVQISFIHKTSAGHVPPVLSVLMNVVPVFFGSFVVGNWISNQFVLWVVGCGLIVALARWFSKNKMASYSWILLFLLFGSIGLSISRVDPVWLYGRPRYLFYPFIFIFWIIIQGLYASHSKRFGISLGAFGLVGLINGVPVWASRHDELSWAAHVRSCRLFNSYSIPIQYDGDRSLSWSLIVPGQDCDKFLERELLDSKVKIGELPTYPYTVFYPSAVKESGSEMIRNHVADFETSSDDEARSLLFELKRGDSILYHSAIDGAEQVVSIKNHEQQFLTELPNKKDWVLLEFSNSKLPANFTVEIKTEAKKLLPGHSGAKKLSGSRSEIKRLFANPHQSYIENNLSPTGRRPISEPFQVGEEVVHKIFYDAHVFNLSVGTIAFKTAPMTIAEGRKSYQFLTSIKSSSWYSRQYSIAANGSVLMDYELLVPSGFTFKIDEPAQSREVQSLFNFNESKARFSEKISTATSGTEEKKREWTILPFSQNAFSALNYLRLFQWKIGEIYSFRLSDNGENLVVKAKALNQEVLKTEIGELSAIKIKLEITSVGDIEPLLHVYVWLAADERKTVLRIESELEFGSLVSEITAITL